ncbi:MAG TPA: cytochrome c oxidase assembly protein, partial [Pirellulales bacterium]
LASPIEPLAALLLQAHMLQHLLLMMVVAPLVWLGDPLVPLVRGVPQPLRRQWVLPLLHWPGLRTWGRWLVHPATALPLFVAANWLWHVPGAYELALNSPGWHRLEHGCFLAAALLFWHPVVRPFPGRPNWSQWLLLPYLVLADVQNTLLAALLTFSNRVLYPHYARVPPLAGLTPLDDQSAAGVLMWVPGSIVFLVPLGWIGLKLLMGQDAAVPRAARNPASPIKHTSQPAPALPLHQIAGYQPASKAAGPGALDLLRLPLLGRFLRWRHARLALQLPAALLAIVIVIDGLRGPQSGAMNLAGILPWIHWRAVVVLGLLAVGNVSCMACPFTLPRSIARRWLPAGYAWPLWLRSKWLAVALVALFFWAYEVFDLWDRPWWTAWLVLGYFAAALAVDGLFRGAAFCKYLCPIGQFNFVQSLVSPWEVRVREPAACSACRTHDCLHGRDGLRGCELELFQPRKAGNMDCTFCLDCVHACPHDNVGLILGSPLAQFEHDRPRSGLGRWSRRPDIAALIGMLSFGAFANAAGMVAPVIEWRQKLAAAWGELSPAMVTSVGFLLAWIAVPLMAVAIATELSRGLGRLPTRRLPLAVRYVYVLAPLGFAMWLAHYGFHFFTSYAAIVPAAQRFAADWGSSALGQPAWACSCCGPVADWLLPAELLVLDFGLLGSLAAGYRLALADVGRPARALRVVLPWAVMIGLLFAAGVWIVFQPMQMRGMLGGGG